MRHHRDTEDTKGAQSKKNFRPEKLQKLIVKGAIHTKERYGSIHLCISIQNKNRPKRKAVSKLEAIEVGS
jgi:hypothetical protein